MGSIIGIDLGTTNSVAAFKMAQVEVVTSDDNTPPDRKLTRSVVSYHNNQFVVGEAAYNQLKQDPENVIISIKRLMGRGFGDSIVKQQLSRFGYKITQSSLGTENSLSVWLANQEYQPEDISAEILKKVVANAQTYQNQQGLKNLINQAVITIPAYFNDKQRYATQTAVTRAGLSLLELLPEPTAAAISYGFQPDSHEAKTILVYDFGGGTFDSSIITVAGNQFLESGKAGDLWLGGDDIDSLLMDHVLNQIAIEEHIDNISHFIDQMPYYHKIRFLGDLKIAVERAKIDLSKSETTRVITATFLLDQSGMGIPIDIELKRSDLEKMITPIVDRTIAICQDTLKYSEYPADMIDVVLMVGGSSQIPYVQQRIKQTFGDDKVVLHPRPLYAVAEGAAIVAAKMTEKVGTVSRDYYIRLADNSRYKLISRGEILPVQTAHIFKTEADGQRLIHFKFFSPDEVKENLDHISSDEVIGEMWLPLDQYYPKGTEILTTLELDEANSYLQATATLKNDPRIRVSCSFSRGGVDEQISRKVEETIEVLNQAKNLTTRGVNEANRIASEVINAANQVLGTDGKIIEDRLEMAQYKLKDLEAFASEEHDIAKLLIREFEFIKESCPFLLQPNQIERLSQISRNLKEAIASHNLSLMQAASEVGQRELYHLPEEVRIILACKEAISRAHTLAPSHAKAMTLKLSQLISALEHQKVTEVKNLWQELLPEVGQYLNQDLPTGIIATGLVQ